MERKFKTSAGLIFLIFCLFSISLLNWIQIPLMVGWKLSVVSSQLGLWMALLALVCFLILPFLKIKIFKKILVGGFALVAMGLFLTPLISVMKQQDQWRAEMTKTFGASKITKTWFSFRKMVFGVAGAPFLFERHVYNSGVLNQNPLHIDRYKPSLSESPSPWVLVIHGGGWNSGSSEQLPELNAYLQSLGYTVFSMNYRLAPQAHWPEIKSDVLRAIAFVKAHSREWNIDTDRWAILGRSAGGQIAGAIAYSLNTSERPRGLISLYAPTDLTFGYDISEEDDLLGSRSLIKNFMGSVPEGNSDLYKTASLMELASKNSCPTLLIHGLKDTLVWEKHTARLIRRLKHLGVPSEAIFLPWGPHGFDFFLSGVEGQISTSAIEHFLEKILL